MEISPGYLDQVSVMAGPKVGLKMALLIFESEDNDYISNVVSEVRI